MSVSTNFVQLIGHLGAAPESTQFESGKQRVTFSMATSESYRDANGENVETTDWHRIVAWGPLAGYLEKNLRKGTKVLVQGKIRHRNYQDKEGVTKYVTEVVAKDVLKLTKEEVTA